MHADIQPLGNEGMNKFNHCHLSDRQNGGEREDKTKMFRPKIGCSKVAKVLTLTTVRGE